MARKTHGEEDDPGHRCRDSFIFLFLRKSYSGIECRPLGWRFNLNPLMVSPRCH